MCVRALLLLTLPTLSSITVCALQAEPAPLPQQQPSDVTESANSSSACTSTTPSCSSSTQGTAAVSSTPLLGSQSSNSKGVEVARLQRIKQLVNDLQKATSSTAGSDSITQGEAAAACQQLLGEWVQPGGLGLALCTTCSLPGSETY